MVKKYKNILIPLLLFLGILIIYITTSGGDTPYNHFTLLADSFIKGKLFITGDYPWLEKVPINGDITNFFVVNPPMPAILAIPFVIFFEKNFPQQYLAHLIGGLLTVSTYFLSIRVKKDTKIAIWSALLVGIGSITWFLSSVGSTWYLGQITAALFLTWVLIEIQGKSRTLLLSLLFGFIYLSRSHLALSFPLITFINWKKYKKMKNLIPLILLFLPFVFFDFSYNFFRFGTIFNKGYFLIPGTLNEPWFAKGIMHPSYILEDLKIAFLKLPVFQNNFPYIVPSWAGLAIWITTPAYFYALKAPRKDKVVKLSWLAIFLIFLVVGAHGGTGFAQFGWRFGVDFYPFLTLLTIKGILQNKGPRKIHWILLFIGFIVNLWGVVWINKFGWVTW